jgi:uncharacterized membrane protein
MIPMTKTEKKHATICAALSYWLVGIVWYFLDEEMKKDKFVAFHAKQGLALYIVAGVLWIGFNLVKKTFFFLSGGFDILLSLTSLGVFILAILGTMHVLHGEMKKLPFVGKFVKKL